MPKATLKIGLIGCGAMGEKRLQAVQRTKLGTISAVVDSDATAAQRLAKQFQAKRVEIVREIWPHCDIAIVATPNSLLSPFALEGLDEDKFVLVEKPGAIGRADLERICRPKCKIGYNHRFHPAALAIKKALQDPLWIRAAYGHGGRPGYENEWRMQKELSGGGEILDQGVHLLDLARYWLKDELNVQGAIRQNAFYSSAVEDNGFLLLRSKQGVPLTLHCSATQWKNLFRVEIGCRDDLWVWEGLGTESYGPERLTRYRRNPEGGVPVESTVTFADASNLSWDEEWRHFYGFASGEIAELISPAQDSLPLFETLEAIYAQ